MSRVGKIIIALSLFGQGAMAQAPAPTPPVGSPPPTGAPTPPPVGAPGAPDVDIGVRQRPTLSAQDMIAQSREYRARMEQILTNLNTMVEQARKQKDVIRLNCLLDKVAQVQANIKIATGAQQALQEAAARNDEGASVHEYTRITIVHQKTQTLTGEAQACVGEDLAFVGATRVDVEVDGIPPGDPTQPTPARPVFDRPPIASPFL
jgi:hypothetical protein